MASKCLGSGRTVVSVDLVDHPLSLLSRDVNTPGANLPPPGPPAGHCEGG